MLSVAEMKAAIAVPQPKKDKILVTIQLVGGNDGLNTVIPYGFGAYYQLRPNLAVKEAAVLPLTGLIGLHPHLSSLHDAFQAGNLAIAVGVGYPNMTCSHFRSTAIWQSAQPETISNISWLDFFPTSEKSYANSNFANKMKSIAQSITSNEPAQVYRVSLTGFDTHTNQAETHGLLLQQFSDSIAAFQKHLNLHNAADRVVILVFSEFGRKPQGNIEGGTDHGTANPVFILGKQVRGGIYGDYPSLSNLEAGNLKPTLDFRSVYATILDGWLGADSRKILGRSFDNLGFV